jgi:putative redox protein
MMANQITIRAEQESLTTTRASVRDHTILIDRPEAKGGTDLGAMGGEILLMSLAGCFMSNLLEIVRTREAAISNIVVDVAGTLSEDKPTRYVAIDMQVAARCEDHDELEKFVLMAERGCIVANSLKQGIELNVSVK